MKSSSKLWSNLNKYQNGSAEPLAEVPNQLLKSRAVFAYLPRNFVEVPRCRKSRPAPLAETFRKHAQDLRGPDLGCGAQLVREISLRALGRIGHSRASRFTPGVAPGEWLTHPDLCSPGVGQARLEPIGVCSSQVRSLNCSLCFPGNSHCPSRNPYLNVKG